MQKMSSQDVYQALRNKIVNGEIASGEKLSEINLAKEFGVSRTPIREALKRLESRKLLTYEQNKGMVVPTLDSQSVSELFVIREMMESTAASLAAKYATEEEIGILKDLVDEDWLRLDEPIVLAKTNKLFHRTINQIAHNNYLIDLSSVLDESLSLLGKTTLLNKDRAEKTLKQHQKIVEAIEKRDFKQAEVEARAHVKSAYRARLRVILDSEMFK